MVIRLLALALILPLAGCWSWDRFEGALDAGIHPDDGGPSDAGIDAPDEDGGPRDAGADGGGIDAPGADGGACGVCPCAGDVCVAGRCAPGEDQRVVSLAAGYHFACFVRADQSVYCMGDDSVQQLGDGSGPGGGSTTPVRALATGFDRTSGGGDSFVVVLAPGGEATYWGLRPGTGGGGSPATSLGRTFTRAPASGGEHVCGIESGGSLACTGANDYGQLGAGDTMNRGSTFATIGGIWLDVSAGLEHTCGIIAVGSERHLRCWGRNDRGQLGLGDTLDRTAPVRVGLDGDWDGVSAGKDFTCGVRAGRVYCWGAGDSRQLGETAATDSLAPVGPIDVAGAAIDGVAAIDSGRFHACLLRDDGTLMCWGNDECGELGDGAVGTTEPEPRAVDGDGLAWTAVEVGNHYTCATREDGSLWCWGRRGDRLAGRDTLCGRTLPDAGIGPPTATPERICPE